MANPAKLSNSWKVALLLFPFILALGIIGIHIILASTDDNANGSNDIDPGYPWENPLLELNRVTNICSMKISNFYEIVSEAQSKWQKCIYEISPKFPELETRSSGEEERKINASVIQEIDKRLYMEICQNTTGFKSCWSDIILALNLCEPGTGDVAETIYYALYDNVCRDGGRITKENRRIAAAAGNNCERDYMTNACRINKPLMSSNDLCQRFESNLACDLSSIDPKCSNTVDERWNVEILKRVQENLGCDVSSSLTFQWPEADGDAGAGATSMRLNFPVYLSVYVLWIIV